MFAGVDGMKSVFMKCSYLSLSSGRVGTMQRKRAKELLSLFFMKNQSNFFYFCVPFIICLEMINFDFKMIYLISTTTVYYGK